MGAKQREIEAREVPQRSRTRICAGIVVEQRYLSQAQPRGLIDALRRRGHETVVIDPEATSFKADDDGWLSGLDVVVARGRSWAVLCLLNWAEAHGIPSINRRAAISAVHNKAEMALALRAGRLPAPLTLFGSPRQLSLELNPAHYPVILKPAFGDNGNGLRIVRTARELAGTAWPEPVALAQQFVENDGYDLKLYCIGGEVWAVRKPSPWLGGGRPQLLPLTTRWRALADQCRQLFELDLFGVDCVQTPAGPLVIEVNEFPNYSGIPEADDKLADHIVRRVRGENLS